MYAYLLVLSIRDELMVCVHMIFSGFCTWSIIIVVYMT